MAPPRLVLLPGSLCTPSLWRGVLRHLRLPPGAPQPLPEAHSTQRTTAAAAEELLAALPPGPIALCGFSVGAYIALEAVRRAQEGRIAALCLLGAQSHPDTDRVKALRRHLVQLARAEGVRAVLERQRRLLLSPHAVASDKLFEHIVEMAEEVGAEGFAAQQAQASSRVEAGDVLRGLPRAVPLLVLAGHGDAVAPEPVQRQMHRDASEAGPGAWRQLHLISHPCGHMAPLERPAAVACALQGWYAAASA
eukprot:TRINITY_DN10562_c0_g1_i3.p4 TRINITY_DN10562_c0_g1~~TRINITY_DN10562_c0_g1_i3.p4  ORF type:complete len:273 (+),score=84.26 TRINITY_DN10562_c0_g1_i3:71-820(+)